MLTKRLKMEMNMENIIKKGKVVLIDNNEQMRTTIKDYLNSDNNLTVAAEFDNANNALNFFKTENVDVVVCDIILPNIDGYEFLEKLNAMQLKNKPKIIILSALASDGFIHKALGLGADYYMIKPCELSLLKERIIQFAGNSFVKITENDNSKVADAISKAVVKMPRNKQLEEKITNIFITVGIPAHIKGYQFLREAIKMAIDNPEIINSITKKLYPSIAERFETSASKVERAIRHAIEVAWNRGKIENINALFGVRVYSNNEKPTNGEFIALVADKMLIEGA
jgi:two-component system response regulator (stage 0 sporulation protein A)